MDTEKEPLLCADETYAIRGAIFEVYREMGSGFLEPVYQECLEREFNLRNLPYVAKCELKLTYKGETLIQTYEPDFVCFGKIIVELKAVKEIAPEHEAQLMNYLTATGLRLGLLVNFGSHPNVEIRRRII
jgi:GxxExxY protein